MNADRLPPDCGPELARRYSTDPAQRLAFAIKFAIVLFGFAALCGWFRTGWIGPVLTLGPYYLFKLQREFTLVLRAGDGWLAVRGRVVRTDRLIRLCVRLRLRGGFTCIFTDAHGSVRVDLADLVADTRLWNLVFRDVRVSGANGLLADDYDAVRIFGVPIRPDCTVVRVRRFLSRCRNSIANRFGLGRPAAGPAGRGTP